MIQAVLKNEQHPEYGVATIPFPIPDEEYDCCVELLETLEIGDAVKRDCQVDEIRGAWPILKHLEGTPVNLDELDYLAKRLDSFDRQEKAQFQGMAEKLNIFNMTELINLTLCCQQATGITDFSDLEAVGRRHYLTMNDGAVPPEDLEKIDGRALAMALIHCGEGVVTPYGVVYDNRIQMELLYDGEHLPEYFYGDCVASVSLSLEGRPGKRETLYFPCTDSKIERTLRRLEATETAQCVAELDTDKISNAVREMFEVEFSLPEHLDTLNALARCYQGFDDQTVEDFDTVIDCVRPQTPEEILYLAENIYDFTVANGIYSEEAYGRYMIKESGHFELDPNLEDYLDFASYGRNRIQEEHGVWGDRGYVAYLGTKPEIEEIMDRNVPENRPEHGLQMGGLT